MRHTPDGRRTDLDVFTATPAEIRRAGLAAVARALGPVGLARFLDLYEGGRGDYTAERDTLVGTPTVDALFDTLAPAHDRTQDRA